MNNPKLVFVASLFTSKIFWSQVIALAAMIATASGAHPQWASEASQAELVGLVDMIATTVFRLWGTNGPVSLSAPLSTPPAQDVSVGVHAVQVAPGGATATVTTMPVGTSTISVPAAAVAPVPPPVSVPPHVAATITHGVGPNFPPIQPDPPLAA